MLKTLNFIGYVLFATLTFSICPTLANAESDGSPKMNTANSKINIIPTGRKIYVVNSIENIHREYQDMIKGFDILDLNSWEKMNLNRSTLEMLIFETALQLGGCKCEIHINDYQVETPFARSIEEVRQGLVISHPIAAFTDDTRVKEGIVLSEPILDPQDLYVGLYTSDKRADILSTTDFDDIKEMNFVVGHDWELDHRVLAANQLKSINADDWKSVIMMLEEERADVVMQPFFSTPDMSFTEEDGALKFLPIPGVKMAFPQGRHFMVSKKHPESAGFLDTLNRGIVILKQNGFLRKAHGWAGVINPQTEDYTVFGTGTIK